MKVLVISIFLPSPPKHSPKQDGGFPYLFLPSPHRPSYLPLLTPIQSLKA